MQNTKLSNSVDVEPTVKQETPANDDPSVEVQPDSPNGEASSSSTRPPRYTGRVNRQYVSKIPLSQSDERIASSAFSR